MQWLKEVQEKMFQDLVTDAKVDYLKNSDRLHVYSDGYFFRILEAMTSDFCLCAWTVGEDSFKTLIQKYITQLPRHDYNINYLGKDFPGYLREYIYEYPWLADLALYEINPLLSQNRAEIEPFDLQTLQNIPLESWETAIFTFQPHLILQKSKWSFQNLHESFRNKVTFSKDLLNRTETNYMFYQNQTENMVSTLSMSEFRALELLQQANSLGDVISSLEDESAASHLFEWFKDWSRLALITSIHFTSDES